MKKIICLLLACTLVFSLCGCRNQDNEDNEDNEDNGDIAYQIGDYITFGSYEQDNDTSNGAEEIEWLVLDIQDGKVLVTSKYALDCQQYNADYSNASWEECTLREWLNNYFIDTAFTEDEKSRIPMVTVPADKQNAGNDIDTQDRVFLLSLSELNEYFDAGDARKCTATAYAEAKGAEDSWWLRSAVNPSGNTDCLNYVGDTYGAEPIETSRGVRPAMWIEIE